MSAPPDRHGATTPLHQRTQSQNNTLGIRIVPYTPPTISDAEGRVPSQASTRSQTTTTTTGAGRDSGLGHGNYGDQTVRRPSWIGGMDRDEDYASSSNPGSALSSSSFTSLLLVKAKDEGVSVPKLSSYPSAPLGSRDPIAPGVRSPSEVSTIITPINASALHASSNTQARFGETPSSVPASPASSTGPPRPLSRRRIVVVTHADKTFSLVRESQSDALGGITSPTPSTSYSSRTTSSHAPPSIDAWSDADTSATVLDNSLSEHPVPSAPSTPSPGPYPKPLAEDHITSSPWNYRMVGGLRKVAKTPDLKGKDSATTLTQERLLAPLPEIIVDREEEEEEEQDEQETRTVVPKASFASIDSAQTFSTTSETTNYKVYGASSSPQPSIDSLPLLPSSSNNPNFEVLGESSSPNYRVLGQSSSPNFEVIGQSSSPNLEGIAESSSPNYRVIGESSSPNYEVIGESSSPNFEILGPSSSPNYEIIAETSSLPGPISSTPSETSDNDENYVLHGDPSPSPSSSAVLPRQPRPTYSQESLVVPPLRPAKKKSYEGFGYYKQRSRENLRGRAGSLQSLKSISSIITTQDATRIVAPVFLDFGASSSRDARAGYSGSTSQQQQQQQQQSPWSGPQAPGSSTGSYTPQSAINQRPVQMIQAHPHQWSSQLSTVMSESEESERSLSRSASPSISGANGHRRRSSLGWGSSSLHSRQLQSISSSLAAQLEEGASGTESPERPQPTLSRSTLSHPPMVRDQDEHGDGITDLAEQPSRSGLSAFFMSSNSSSRNLHSSASSRSNSFTSASIPAWARVYYGSGERKFLGTAPSIAGSDVGDISRPPSTGIYGASNSPSPDHYSMAIYSQRKRAREINPHPSQRPFSDAASMDIAPAPMGDYNVFRSIKRKTSSIWSPHLRHDRRASRYSVWNPPSVSWSADSRILGKRNAQVVLFIVGFIFPFAWMIAALLPLPPNPKFEMLERGDNDGNHHRSRSKLPDFRTIPPPRPRIVDETRFESARWWRNLNRIMSVVGLLIIGAVIALAVVGVREHWVADSSSSSS
ncbi:hypothetical protein V8F33_004271 [Rhypophila sp. PSN 637]